MKRHFSSFQKAVSALMLYALMMPIAALASDSKSDKKQLTEDQKILHVLNRLGFGARPGDVEKVKAMGLQKYIDQQLNPSSIDDSAAEARVKNLEVFDLSTAELFARYPNPGALLRQLEGRKKTPTDANKSTTDPANAAKMPPDQDPNTITEA